MTNRYLTPTEYLELYVSKYPSLFAAPTYDQARYKVMEHTFNVLGNGIDIEQLQNQPLSIAASNEMQKWFRCSNGSYGYDTSDKHAQPIICVPTDERSKYPYISRWLDFDTAARIDNPYPNFKQHYSLVWETHFREMGSAWAREAIWYYTICKEFFEDPSRVVNYSHAFPNTHEDPTVTIETYKQALNNKTRYPTNESITKAYGCEFIGDTSNNQDVSNFIARRWKQDHARIIEFIDKTLVYMSILADPLPSVDKLQNT